MILKKNQGKGAVARVSCALSPCQLLCMVQQEVGFNHFLPPVCPQRSDPEATFMCSKACTSEDCAYCPACGPDAEKVHSTLQTAYQVEREKGSVPYVLSSGVLISDWQPPEPYRHVFSSLTS